MESIMDFSLLCCFEDDVITEDLPSNVQLLWKGDWKVLMTNPVVDAILRGDDKTALLKKYLDDNASPDLYLDVLVVGIASLYRFCEANWTGPDDSPVIIASDAYTKSIDEYKSTCLNNDDVIPTIIQPELLLLAIEIFNGLPDNSNKLITTWWKLRSYYIYQKILEERSPLLLSVLEGLLDELTGLEEGLDSQPKMKVLLNLEMSQVYLLFGRVQNSEKCLNKARAIAGFSSELRGALGKRTKYQQVAVSQLTLDTVIRDSAWRQPAKVTHANTSLPKPLKLDDDLRLEKVQYLDINEGHYTDLSSIEQLICLATVQYIQRSQPKDALADEELFPYVNIILANEHGAWATRICTLLLKCKLESNHKRTVERSMMQCEEIVNNFQNSQPEAKNRLSYLWASGLPPVVEWRSQLADLLLSIGLVKTALDWYLKLQLWEDVIVCYTILEQRHNAAEIIQQQIAIKPTVKLYCLLGDATDNSNLYRKAWDFSKHKSSRAQRHWGNYLFAHKKYEECIPHYQKSCEINSLQELVWFRLGYAALMVENWEVSATAYRRYTFLEPHSFEAWNNLAKVYVKQGNKQRAYKALNEALKYNYDNWQVWENMILISLDTGHFDDVIRSYHRLLDLRMKHLDLEVLTLLVKAILQDSLDAEGNSIKRIIPKVLELFGRITTSHPRESELWRLYADISPNSLLRGQRLLKSYTALSQSGIWSADPTICEIVLNLIESLATSSLKAIEEAEGTHKDTVQAVDLLASSRLSIQAVVRAVKSQEWSQFEEKLTVLEGLLQKVTLQLTQQLHCS